MLGNLGLEGCPVLEVGGSHTPHVVLQLALRHRAAFIGGVGSLNFSKLARGFQGAIVDRLKDLFVKQARLFRLKRQPHKNVSVSKALDTNSNWSVSHVAVPSLLHGVEVHLNDLVQVLRRHLGHLLQALKVVGVRLLVHKSIDGNGGKIADSYFIRSRVLHDFCAKVGTLDGPQVLLVALSVARVLVEHVRSSGFNLRLNNGVPQLLCFDGLLGPPLLLIPGVKLLELISPDLVQARAFMGTHERPLTVFLNSLHEEIRDPESIEKVPCPLLLLAMVLLQVKEVKDIGMPGFKVDGKSSRPLVSALVDIASSVVEHPQHRHQAIAVAVGAGNVGSTCPDVVDVEPDPPGRLGDESALLEGVVDALDAVAGHREEEAGGKLGPGGGCIKESRGGMSEKLLGEQVIGLNGCLYVLTMDANRHPHQHLLRSLHHLTVDLQQVRPLRSLEAKVLVLKVPVIDNGRVQPVLVVLDDLVVLLRDHWDLFPSLRASHAEEVSDDVAEAFLRLLVKVGHSNPGGQEGVVWVFGGHGGGHLGGEVVQLHRGHARVQPIDHLESNSRNVQVFSSEPITKLLNSAGDLVKVNSLRPSISFEDNHLAAGNLRHLYLLFARAGAGV